MLHNKDIKNLSELKKTFVINNKKEKTFSNLIDVLKIGKHHALFSKVKQKGISVIILIKILITFPFLEEKNVYSFTKSYWNKFANFGKDAYYRLKNNPKIDWRKFLFAIVKRTIITLSERRQDNEIKDIKAFIFDDTSIAKTGILIEGVSRVWNHVIQKSILGYQLLTMGLYDGTMFIPINFSFHREKGKNKKNKFGLKPKYFQKQFKKKRNKNSAGHKRKQELDISKIASVAKMIKTAIKNGITANYVITDSWFTCWELVKITLENKMHYIGMFSKVKTLFLFKKKNLSYKKIRHLNRKKITRSKRYNLYYIRVVVEWHKKPIVLYFIRQGKRGNWKTILSTDLSLNFNKTIEIYQLRWSIEVFFKETKQLLNLGKSQSNDFDAQIADTTITMIQYMFLALRKRIDKYESIGQLYRNTKAETLDLKLHERLIMLLFAVLEIIKDLFEDSDSEKIFIKLINDEHTFEKIKILLNMSQDEQEKAA